VSTRRNRTAEISRLENEERLRLATEHADIGFWDVDDVNQVLHWPPIVKATFGISADVPVSMADFYAGLHPDDAAATAAAYAAAADPDRRALYDVEYRTIGKEDGIVRWVAAKGRGIFDDNGRCLRVVGTAIDITHRKSMEAKLLDLTQTLEKRIAETSADLDRIWSNAGDLLLVVDKDAVVRRINPAACRLLGWSEYEMIGRTMLDILYPEDLQTSLQALAKAATEPLKGFENRYVTRNGDVRTISWTTAPEASLIYAYGRDVTEQRARQAELDAAQAALRQSQKMEAMGELTGGVAHDFNNLLTPIIGALDLLQRRGIGGERERRLIAGAMQSSERAKTLVQRLLAFARRQPLQPLPIDIAELVDSIHELIASTIGPHIKVVVDVPRDLPAARADPNQIEMALVNLVVNARDAMPQGGTVRISAATEFIEGGHRAKVRRGEYVRLSVADAGVGMNAETLARAVEPFYSTKGIGKGTGLGLSMVHGLVLQLGGGLTIQSLPGAGTTVELWLPVSTDRVISTATVPSTMPSVSFSGTVLLVDDEEAVRITIADMLLDLGYSVIEASSAEEALTLSRGRFDMMITDHLMTGMNGTDLARVLRSARPDLPVLLVSGYADLEGLDPSLPRLTKPFRKDDLAAILAHLTA